MRVFIIGETGLLDGLPLWSMADTGDVMMYVKQNEIPFQVGAELRRITPSEIVVVGGTARVSDSVLFQLERFAPTSRVAGATRFDTPIAIAQAVHPIVTVPPVEPPVVPPVGMFIPKLQGPVLQHDGNPTVMSGFLHNTNTTRVITNAKIMGSVRVENGLVILRDCEIDGQQGEYCVAGWGGRALVERSWIHNAKDGFKDNVDSVQTTITDLYLPSGVHGDCVQLQGSGSKATHKWGYFDCGVGSGNAAFIIKNDLGNGALQEITVEDSFIGGGNYTVFLRNGGAGGAPAVSNFSRVLYRDGNWKYGLLSADAPAPSQWDVSAV